MRRKTTWMGMAAVSIILLVGVSYWWMRQGSEMHRNSVPTVWTQEAYVWQRRWTPAVVKAVRESSREDRLDGLCVLAGELRWNGDEPQMVAPEIKWEELKIERAQLALAWRLPLFQGKPAWDERVARLLESSVDAMLSRSEAEGLRVKEVQLDYDCPTSRLKEYAEQVRSLRKGRDGVIWSVTALPAWLDAPGMRVLAEAVDGMVLQVHWLHRRLDEDGNGQLVDEAAAKRAVQACVKLGVPFRVALPTYGNGILLDEAGRWLDVVAEEEERVMPEGYQMREVRSDPILMQRLVREWGAQRPGDMTGVVWYRLPVEGEARNWQWKTFAAVLKGESLAAKFEARRRQREEGFEEVIVENIGNVDGLAPTEIVAANTGEILVSDGANGYTVEESELGLVWKNAEPRMLRAGQSLHIGWWRVEGDSSQSHQVRLRIK